MWPVIGLSDTYTSLRFSKLFSQISAGLQPLVHASSSKHMFGVGSTFLRANMEIGYEYNRHNMQL